MSRENTIVKVRKAIKFLRNHGYGVVFTGKTCDVYEYDGGFFCSRHKRHFGVGFGENKPCCQVVSKIYGGWHRECPTIQGESR